MEEGVGIIYTRSVHAQAMSLTKCVFNTSLPNSNSAAALHPRRPSTPSTTSQVFNTCEVAPVCPRPHTPSPESQSRPTATHPPRRQQPALATNSVTHHAGITGVTWPIADHHGHTTHVEDAPSTCPTAHRPPGLPCGFTPLPSGRPDTFHPPQCESTQPHMRAHTMSTPQLDVTPSALAMLESMRTFALTATHPSPVLLDPPPPGPAAMTHDKANRLELPPEV